MARLLLGLTLVLCLSSAFAVDYTLDQFNQLIKKYSKGFFQIRDRQFVVDFSSPWAKEYCQVTEGIEPLIPSGSKLYEYERRKLSREPVALPPNMDEFCEQLDLFGERIVQEHLIKIIKKHECKDEYGSADPPEGIVGPLSQKLKLYCTNTDVSTPRLIRFLQYAKQRLSSRREVVRDVHSELFGF